MREAHGDAHAPSQAAADSRYAGRHWDEVEPELRELFKVPDPLRLLWVVPIGHARSWPKPKPRRPITAFTHYETYETKKLRRSSDIHAWPKD